MRMTIARRGVALAGAGLLAIALSASAQTTEITVGAALPLTGRFSTEGTEFLKAYQLFVEDTNRAGGVTLKSAGTRRPLRLVHYDDQSDPSASARLYERLITSDKVDLLLGPWGSGHNFAVTAVTEKHRMPLVTASAAADSIFNRGFKYIFNTTDVASYMPGAVVSYLKTRGADVKTVAILYENFLFTTSLHDVIVKELGAAGFTIVLDERYPLAGKDFTGLLTKAKLVNPDAVIVYNVMPASIYATRQLHELGLKPKFYFVNIGPTYTKDFIEALGKGSEGVVEFGFFHPDLPFPGTKEFTARFRAKFGALPAADAFPAYTAGQILVQAVERAGTLEPEKVNDVLHREEFMSVGGKYKYDERGVNIHPKPFLTQVQDGKLVIVWPQELTPHTLRFPVFGR
jgi:branched-chain amino acid transport system substrate-binding protein